MAIGDKNIVGALFWANMAAEQVYNSFEKRAKSVVELQNLIKWLFSLFTAGGLVLSFFAKPGEYNLAALVFFGLGFSVLVIAYFLTTQVAFPVPMELRPNQPGEIQTAYTEAIITNTSKFQIASLVTFIGFFFIAVGILIQFATPPPKTEPIKKEFSVKTSIQKTGSEVSVPVTTFSSPSSTVWVRISGGVINKDSTIFEKPFEPDTDGRMYCSPSFSPKKVKSIKVTIRAEETTADKVLMGHTFSKDLAVP